MAPRPKQYEMRWVYKAPNGETTIHRAKAFGKLQLEELIMDTLRSGRVLYFSLHLNGKRISERFVTGDKEIHFRSGTNKDKVVWI